MRNRYTASLYESSYWIFTFLFYWRLLEICSILWLLLVVLCPCWVDLSSKMSDFVWVQLSRIDPDTCLDVIILLILDSPVEKPMLTCNSKLGWTRRWILHDDPLSPSKRNAWELQTLLKERDRSSEIPISRRSCFLLLSIDAIRVIIFSLKDDLRPHCICLGSMLLSMLCLKNPPSRGYKSNREGLSNVCLLPCWCKQQVYNCRIGWVYQHLEFMRKLFYWSISSIKFLLVWMPCILFCGSRAWRVKTV